MPRGITVTEETQSVSSVAGGDEDNVELAEELRAALAGEVLADPLNRAFYSTDASVHQVRPLLAVVPAGAEGAIALWGAFEREQIKWTQP